MLVEHIRQEAGAGQGAARLGRRCTGPIGWIGTLDLNLVGYVIVGLFVAVWAIALAVWRFGRIEQKWASPLPQAAADTEVFDS
jgi:hypothetical protein